MVRRALRQVADLLRTMGYEVRRMNPAECREPRPHWLRKLSIDLLIDVGANTGQYAARLRELGFSGAIVSFEPQSAAFHQLKKRAMRDGRWRAINCGLGEEAGEMPLYLAGNSLSSSLLPMLERHVEALPESAYTGVSEIVPIRRLDAMLADEARFASALLKIDAQGYEIPILRGSTYLLGCVKLLEMEISLVQLYEGQALLQDMWNEVVGLGFEPVWIERGFVDHAQCQALQIDALFVRKGATRTVVGAVQ